MPTIIICWKLSEISKISSTKVQFFSILHLFPKYFCAKLREILMSGSQEIGMFPTRLFCIQSQFLTRGFSVTKENMTNAVPFLTYLSNKRLKPSWSIHCLNYGYWANKTIAVSTPCLLLQLLCARWIALGRACVFVHLRWFLRIGLRISATHDFRVISAHEHVGEKNVRLSIKLSSTAK